MKIGELAKRADVPIDTVRYYEREGVIPTPTRRESGYRDYGEVDVKRLQFVRRAKRLGFTLSEVRDLLGLSEDCAQDMATFSHHASDKLKDIDTRIEELQRVRSALEALVRECPGRGRLDTCPILATLSGDGP